MKKGFFIILCGLLILTAGCSKKDKVTKKTFEDSLDTQFHAAVNMVEDEEVPEFLSELEDRNGYEIISFEEDGQVADAVVRVKAPDLYSTAKKITDMRNEQNVDANVGNFIFSAKCFQTLDGQKFAYPHVIMAMDRYAGAGNIPVIDTLVTGMTYAEVKEQIPVITELTSENMGRYYATTGAAEAEAVYYWDLDATIYCIFDGTGEDAVLIGVEVDRMNNYNL